MGGGLGCWLVTFVEGRRSQNGLGGRTCGWIVGSLLC